MRRRSKVLLALFLAICIAGPDRGVEAQVGPAGGGPSIGVGSSLPPGIFATTVGASVGPLPLGPEPAIPAGCTKPSLTQCTDGDYYRTNACAKDPAKGPAVRAHCTWQLQKQWNASSPKGKKGFNPVTQPNEPYALLAPGKPVERSKSFAPTGVGLPPSAQKVSKGHRVVPGYSSRTAPSSRTDSGALRKYDLTPTAARGTYGTYGSAAAAAAVTASSGIASNLFAIDQGATLGAAQGGTLGGVVLAQPLFVTPGATVTSCEDYAFKRWGDYSKFAWAAKRLGKRGREIYNLAMDPASPVFLNKSQLNQMTGPNSPAVPIPVQIPAALKWGGSATPYWPVNAFVAADPVWLDEPRATVQGTKVLVTPAEKAAIKGLIASQWGTGNNRRPRRIGARSDFSPLGLFKELKQNLDSRYGNPTDDELRDTHKRSATYQDLVTQRIGIEKDWQCARADDPCFICRPPPGQGMKNQLHPGLAKIRDRVTGAPVINPADVSALFNTGSIAARYEGLLALSAAGDALQGLEVPASAGAAVQAGAKRKALPTSLDQLKASGQGVTVVPAGNACLADLVSKRPALYDALVATEQRLTKLLVNELRFQDRGCLASPGSGIANMCDWNYDDFGAILPTLLDDDVSADATFCNDEMVRAHKAAPTKMLSTASTTAKFNHILAQPKQQSLVFPCAQRRDFTKSAPEVTNFLALDDGEGRPCEAALQNKVIEGQQAAVATQLEGIPWVPGEKKISQSAADELELGDRDVLGAKFSYDSSWEVRSTAAKDDGPLNACKFEGRASQSALAKVYFFGGDLELFKLNSDGTAKPNGSVTASASHLDLDAFPPSATRTLFNVSNKPAGPNTPFVRPLVYPPIVLGAYDIGFWTMVGPIPLHIEFGVGAIAGLDYKFLSAPGDNCSNMTSATGFELESQITPYAAAGAYADASLDVGVASAGVRLELDLLHLAVPIGVRVRNTSTSSGWLIENNGNVLVDLLDGRMSAYVEIGIAPAAVTYETTVFSWNGFHTSVPLFGLQKNLNQEAMRIVMAGLVTDKDVTCKCTDDVCCSGVQCLKCGANTGLCGSCSSPRVRPFGGEKYFCALSSSDAQVVGQVCSKYARP
jgi:hypothetical protein